MNDIEELEKRVTDLERQVKFLRKIMKEHIEDHENEAKELTEILPEMQKAIAAVIAGEEVGE